MTEKDKPPSTMDELRAKYPDILSGYLWHGKQVYNYNCGNGWIPLLDSLLDLIQQRIKWHENDKEPVPPVKVVQIKEKFACLRFYFDGGDDHINGMVSMAERMSSKICEACGKPGKSRNLGWYKTLCDDCMATQTK